MHGNSNIYLKKKERKKERKKSLFDVCCYILRCVCGEEFRADVDCKFCAMLNEAVVAVFGWTESGESRRR